MRGAPAATKLSSAADGLAAEGLAGLGEGAAASGAAKEDPVEPVQQPVAQLDATAGEQAAAAAALPGTGSSGEAGSSKCSGRALLLRSRLCAKHLERGAEAWRDVQFASRLQWKVVFRECQDAWSCESEQSEHARAGPLVIAMWPYACRDGTRPPGWRRACGRSRSACQRGRRHASTAAGAQVCGHGC